MPDKTKRRKAIPRRALPSATDGKARLIGIGFICLALFCFALLDTTAKWLTGQMDTVQVVWARYASHFILSFLFVNPWTTPGLLRTSRPWLQLGRSALLVCSTFFNFVALRYLQLDQTAALMFTTPFFIAVLAGPLLGEWIGWRRWVAIMVGFAGVLLVTRPGAGGIHPAAIFSLISAVCYALYNITTRMLASYDSTQTTLFYSSLVGFLAASVPVAFFWTPPAGPSAIAGMVAIGAFGWIGHWLLIAAHRQAPAPVLAPFIYFQIVWMAAAGFFVFGDLPSGWTLAGAAVVIACGLYLLNRERKMRAVQSIKAQTGE
jgi:drug/metabolite transporter (DMT)-like permease